MLKSSNRGPNSMKYYSPLVESRPISAIAAVSAESAFIFSVNVLLGGCNSNSARSALITEAKGQEPESLEWADKRGSAIRGLTSTTTHDYECDCEHNSKHNLPHKIISIHKSRCNRC